MGAFFVLVLVLEFCRVAAFRSSGFPARDLPSALLKGRVVAV
jgi:hypothetical protein